MRWTPEDFAQAIGAFRREWAGMARRMVIGAVPGSVWQMLGHVLFDVTSRESFDFEVFSGIGFFARPSSGGTAEAIVLDVGGANGGVAIATRDEAARAMVDDLQADETAMFNTTSRVETKADGGIEARTHAGTAAALAFEADFAAIVNILATWAVVPNDGGAALKAAIGAYIAGKPPGWPFGTKKFKAE